MIHGSDLFFPVEIRAFLKISCAFAILRKARNTLSQISPSLPWWTGLADRARADLLRRIGLTDLLKPAQVR
jgi:hypothetical protein